MHPWDVHGAPRRAGLRGCWLDRGGASYPSVFDPPDVCAPDLPALAEALLA